MATITLTIPDAVMPRVIDALTADGDYDAIPDPKPARGQFAKAQVVDYVKRVVRQHEAQVAAEGARATADAKAETEILIT